MDGDEQICQLFVRDGGTSFQWNERVFRARHNDFGPKFSFDKLLEPCCYIQNQFLFGESSRTNGASVVTTMSSIDHDARQFKAETANKRTRPIVRCLCGSDHLRLSWF